jgi:hypothetical protein
MPRSHLHKLSLFSTPSILVQHEFTGNAWSVREMAVRQNGSTGQIALAAFLWRMRQRCLRGEYVYISRQRGSGSRSFIKHTNTK